MLLIIMMNYIKLYFAEFFMASNQKIPSIKSKQRMAAVFKIWFMHFCDKINIESTFDNITFCKVVVVHHNNGLLT